MCLMSRDGRGQTVGAVTSWSDSTSTSAGIQKVLRGRRAGTTGYVYIRDLLNILHSDVIRMLLGILQSRAIQVYVMLDKPFNSTRAMKHSSARGVLQKRWIGMSRIALLPLWLPTLPAGALDSPHWFLPTHDRSMTKGKRVRRTRTMFAWVQTSAHVPGTRKNGKLDVRCVYSWLLSFGSECKL